MHWDSQFNSQPNAFSHAVHTKPPDRLANKNTQFMPMRPICVIGIKRAQQKYNNRFHNFIIIIIMLNSNRFFLRSYHREIIIECRMRYSPFLNGLKITVNSQSCQFLGFVYFPIWLSFVWFFISVLLRLASTKFYLFS